MLKILLASFSLFIPLSVCAEISTCIGSTSNGRLLNGVQLPPRGENFKTYSLALHAVGRTYVHSAVREIVLNSYRSLHRTMPAKVFKYAETGYRGGGRFKPHKTHQNGLSVDFMTPVTDQTGQSVHLPTTPFNKFGYSIEFDSDSRYNGFQIDYIAMAAHIVSLHEEAEKLGYGIWRVIFDPELQPGLLKTEYGKYLKKHVNFSKKPSWVRHDDHYHVDFSVPCKAAS